MLEDSEECKLNRSVDWMVDVLKQNLKKVVAMRGGNENLSLNPKSAPDIANLVAGKTPLDEVVEIIDLPSQERSYPVDPSDIALPQQVETELRDYVHTIASLYNRNHFHSFEQ